MTLFDDTRREVREGKQQELKSRHNFLTNTEDIILIGDLRQESIFIDILHEAERFYDER